MAEGKKINGTEQYPVVSAIVLNWNGKEDTLECLDSLRKLDYPKDRIEIIVSDNGSTDGSQEAIKKKFEEMKNEGWKKLELVENGVNLGVPAAYNRAWKKVGKDAKYIFKLDNDVVLKNDVLNILVDRMESNSEIGVISPRIVYYSDPKITAHGAGFIQWWRGKPFWRDSQVLVKCDFVMGCASLIRREAIEKLGRFLDERFFVYWDDTDLCLELRKIGYFTYYEPSTYVAHKVSRTTGYESPFRVYYMSRNKVLFMRKHASLVNKLLFCVIHIFWMPVYIVWVFTKYGKSSIKYPLRRNWAYLKGYLHGFLNRHGKVY